MAEPPHRSTTTAAATLSSSSTPSATFTIFTVPPPVRRLFARFPLLVYGPSDLPARCPDEESRTRHQLHLFSSPTDALKGLPSYNPTCLKWQAFLRLAGMEADTVASCNHASPTGVLPFLIPAASAAAIEAATTERKVAAGKDAGSGERKVGIPLHHRTVLPVTSGKLEEFALEHCKKSQGPGKKGRRRPRVRDVEGVTRVEAYRSLLDSRIRNAWLHSLYLVPENTELLCRLYINPTSQSFFARTSTLHTLRRAAEAEILRSSSSTVIDAAAIYAAADEAVDALSIALGDDRWFFEHERGSATGEEDEEDKEVALTEEGGGKRECMPSIFDAAVFAYTHLLLDPDMMWRDRRLAELVAQSERLVRHRERILEICWPELAR